MGLSSFARQFRPNRSAARTSSLLMSSRAAACFGVIAAIVCSNLTKIRCSHHQSQRVDIIKTAM
jgi:hypothetical protein